MIAFTAQEYDENEYKNGPVKSKPLLYADFLRRPKEPQSNVKSFIMQQNFLESDDKLSSLGFFQHEESYKTLKLAGQWEHKEDE